MINQLIQKASKLLKVTNATVEKNDFYFKRIYFKQVRRLFKSYNVNVQDKKVEFTHAQINPLGLNFGCSPASVRKELGTPRYMYDNGSNTHHHEVYFFRISFINLSLLVQVQFFNKQLFFIAIETVRSILDEHEKSEIINTVIQKYLNKPFVNGESYPLIKDIDQNFIEIHDDNNFSICYLGGGIDEAKQANIIKGMEHALKEKPEKRSLFYAF